MYSQIADISYKRLTRTITCPPVARNLSFWTSYDTELAWDHLFVEAHTPGQDDWTTLPDLNGHTTTEPGDSCPAGWRELHPQLDHYQTLQRRRHVHPDRHDRRRGTRRRARRAAGSSGTSTSRAYAGAQVEISIAYVSDWAIQGLGVFLDDIVVSTGEGTTSFEGRDLDGWVVSGAAAGSAPNANDFARITAAGFPEGAVVVTDDTIYMGFGFEGISDAATRDDVMGDAMNHLLNTP